VTAIVAMTTVAVTGPVKNPIISEAEGSSRKSSWDSRRDATLAGAVPVLVRVSGIRRR
jgi:hypothetical protein